MEQSYFAPPAPAVTPAEPATETRDALEGAAAEFSRNVQEATGKLVAAAESFSSMSSGLNAAVNEVREASAKAQEAQKAAEEAKTAAEATQARMDRDYANLKGLMSDLQERIGALAVLARPFNLDAEPSIDNENSLENSTDENSTESSSDESGPAAENAPSPAGWQGWRG